MREKKASRAKKSKKYMIKEGMDYIAQLQDGHGWVAVKQMEMCNRWISSKDKIFNAKWEGK